MGIFMSVVSKFRKKTSTKEILEQIDEDIDKYQATIQRNRQLQKTTVLFLLTASVLIYLLAAAVFYLWYMPTKWSQRALYLLPFLGFPVIVFLLRKVLHWVFVTRISKTSRTLENLKKEKKKILENVMETETYKVAKELLQKFDPNRKLVEDKETSQDADVKNQRDTSTQNTPAQGKQPGTDLRKRNVGGQPAPGTQHQQQLMMRPQMTPAFTPRVPHGAGMRNPAMQLRFPTPNPGMSPRLPHANAPILPRDRSVFDKEKGTSQDVDVKNQVAEYFVGDGPSNRYALICAQCYSHNGMALMEEFEYIAYKCCYCQYMNPARKQRPNAPKLEDDSMMKKSTLQRASSTKSSTETEDDDDDNNDVKTDYDDDTRDANSKDEGIESAENLLTSEKVSDTITKNGDVITKEDDNDDADAHADRSMDSREVVSEQQNS